MNILSWLGTYFKNHNSSNDKQLLIFGDFNLPKFRWKEECVFTTSMPNYVLFEKFMDDNFLCQYIKDNSLVQFSSVQFILFYCDNKNNKQAQNNAKRK